MNLLKAVKVNLLVSVDLWNNQGLSLSSINMNHKKATTNHLYTSLYNWFSIYILLYVCPNGKSMFSLILQKKMGVRTFMLLQQENWKYVLSCSCSHLTERFSLWGNLNTNLYQPLFLTLCGAVVVVTLYIIFIHQ